MRRKVNTRKKHIRSIISSGYSSAIGKKPKKMENRRKILKEKSGDIRFERKKSSVYSHKKSKLNLTPDCIRNPDELFCENVDGWEKENQLEKYPTSMLQSYLNNRKSHLRTIDPFSKSVYSKGSIEKSKSSLQKKRRMGSVRKSSNEKSRESKKTRKRDRSKKKSNVARTENERSFVLPKKSVWTSELDNLERKMNLSMEANPEYLNIEQVRNGTLISPITYNENVSHLNYDGDISRFKRSSNDLSSSVMKSSSKDKLGYLSNAVNKKKKRRKRQQERMPSSRESDSINLEFKFRKKKRRKKSIKKARRKNSAALTHSKKERENDLIDKFMQKKKEMWKAKSLILPKNKSTDTLKMNHNNAPSGKKTPRLRTSSIKRNSNRNNESNYTSGNGQSQNQATLEFTLKIDEDMLNSGPGNQVMNDGTFYGNGDFIHISNQENSHPEKDYYSLGGKKSQSIDYSKIQNNLIKNMNSNTIHIPVKSIIKKHSSVQAVEVEGLSKETPPVISNSRRNSISIPSKTNSRKTSQSYTSVNQSSSNRLNLEKMAICPRDIDLSEANKSSHYTGSVRGSRRNSRVIKKSVTRKTYELPDLFNGARKSVVEVADPIVIIGKNPEGKNQLHHALSFNANHSGGNSGSSLNSTRKNLFKNDYISSNQITLNHTKIEEGYLSSIKKQNDSAFKEKFGDSILDGSRKIDRKLSLNDSSYEPSQILSKDQNLFSKKEEETGSVGEVQSEELRTDSKKSRKEKVAVFSEVKTKPKRVNYSTFKSSRTLGSNLNPNEGTPAFRNKAKYSENNSLFGNSGSFTQNDCYDDEDSHIKQKFDNILDEIKNGLRSTNVNGKIDILENTSVHFSDFKDFEDENNPSKLKKIIRDLEIENREKDAEIIKLSMQVKDLTSLVNSMLRGKKNKNPHKRILRKKLTSNYARP